MQISFFLSRHRKSLAYTYMLIVTHECTDPRCKKKKVFLKIQLMYRYLHKYPTKILYSAEMSVDINVGGQTDKLM